MDSAECSGQILRQHVMTMRKHITLSEIEHAWIEHNRSGNVPVVTADILDLHTTRFQQTHEDYHPVDLECIQWITDQISSLQLLSLHSVLNDESFNLYDEIIEDLRTMRNFFKFGKSLCSKTPVTDHLTIHPRNLQTTQILLFQQMDWISQYSTPEAPREQWFRVHCLLDDIQAAIPLEMYKVSNQALDEWFESIHRCWDNLLREVRDQLFSRTFNTEKDPLPFQQSIHWAGFFHMFVADYANEDPLLITVKHLTMAHQEVRLFLKAFIDDVEDILPSKNDSLGKQSFSVEEALKDLALDMVVIQASLDMSHWFEEWCADRLRQAWHFWIDILRASEGGELINCPKAITAAKVIWNMEALVAALEPTLYVDKDACRALMQLRRNLHHHVFRIVLNGSWI